MNKFRIGLGVFAISIFTAVVVYRVDNSKALTISDEQPSRKSGSTAHSKMNNGASRADYKASALANAPQFVLDTIDVVSTDTTGNATFDLTYTGRVALLSDHRIFAFPMRSPGLLLFSADGKLQRTMGRNGRGPNEFEGVMDFARLADDTLLVVDPANLRISRITADGGFVDSRPLPKIDQFYDALIAGVLPRGRMVMHFAGAFPIAKADSAGYTRTPIIVVDSASNSTEVARIADMQMTDVATNYRGRPNQEHRPVRFTSFANIEVWDTLIVTASSNRYRIDLRNGSGDVIREFGVETTRRPVTPVMRDMQIATELKRLHGAQIEGGRMVDPRESERLIHATPFADSLPAFQQLFVSTDNKLWVVDAMEPGALNWTATAFDIDGLISGRLRANIASRPMSFGKNAVVVRYQNDDDVVSLRTYRIIPAKGSTASVSGSAKH